jgi:hypothetical protein
LAAGDKGFTVNKLIAVFAILSPLVLVAAKSGKAAGENLEVSGGLEDQTVKMRHEVAVLLETIRVA